MGQLLFIYNNIPSIDTFFSMITERAKQPPWKRPNHSEAKEVDFQIAVADVFKIKVATITAGEMIFQIAMARGHVMVFEVGTEAAGGRLDVVS